MRNPFEAIMCIMFISLDLLAVVSADLIRGKSQSERSSFIQLNYIVSLALLLLSLLQSAISLFEAADVQLVPFNLVCKERNKCSENTLLILLYISGLVS